MAIAAAAIGGLSACESAPARASTPEGMCAYLVGNGNQTRGNRTVNRIIYPGNAVDYNSDYDKAYYFPCGPRNYVVSTTSSDAGGTELLYGRTRQGTLVKVSVASYWMPNLEEGVLRQFITLCQKYNCANDNLDGDGSASNFASDGWNGMLQENFHPALKRAAKGALGDIDDSAWQTGNQDERVKLAGEISDKFRAEVQTATGFIDPIFCSSGSIGSRDAFDCGNVRIVVDGVAAADDSLQQTNDDQIKQQREIEVRAKTVIDRINLSNQTYGPELGALLRACEDRPQATCVLGDARVQVNK